MNATAWLVIPLMIGLNAVFAAYEIALASVSVGRLKALSDAHRPGAKAALAMKQNMEASLAVVQLGITLVGAVAAATGGVEVGGSVSPWIAERFGASQGMANFLSLLLLVVPLSAVTIVIGELIPKVFAIKHKEWVCLQLSPSMQIVSLLVYPAVWILESTVTSLMHWGSKWQPSIDGSKAEVSEMQELRAVVALARTSRLIGGQEEQIILGAARLSVRPIDEIMIPTPDIITLDLHHTMSESLVLAHADMHTRFPVCEEPGDPQTICGYVNFKDIVSELRLSPDQPSLRGIMRAIPDVSANTPISIALQRMIHTHVHIALVRDQQSRQIVGMVTLEDILEELVGDIQDEYDRAPTHLSLAGNGWVMGGGVTLDRLEQATGITLDRSKLPPECRTLSDWIDLQLPRAVRGGDIVRQAGLRIVVRKVRRQMVLEAQVARDTAAVAATGPQHNTAPHDSTTAAPHHDSPSSQTPVTEP